jgi:preprotein translocase subunit SecA
MSDAGVVPAMPALPRPHRYFERKTPKRDAADRALARLQGALLPYFDRLRTRRLGVVVTLAAGLEPRLALLDDGALHQEVAPLRARLRCSGTEDVAAVAKAFALVREVSRRHLGLRHHDVQLLGGFALVKGMIAEMRTGEGKTLTATLAAVTMALVGRPVHVVTVNDYLAQRDEARLRPVYAFFGLSTSTVVEGLSEDRRREAYQADIVYCTNKELAFDHLRDRLVLARLGGNLRRKLDAMAGGGAANGTLILRGLHFAIVDEVDSVLIDEARTPLILSASIGSDDEAALWREALALACELDPGRDFLIHAEERRVQLTRSGDERLSARGKALGGVWLSETQRLDLALSALTALHVMQRDHDYIVRDGKIQLVDEYSGRIMPDRSWSNHLQQMVEAKESLDLTPQRVTLARLTYQRLFRRYETLSGMTGTAREVAGELFEVYGLLVAAIPTHRPARLRMHPDQVFDGQPAKWRAIVALTQELHARGVPVLIGTRSVAASRQASAMLTQAGLAHRVLNAENDAFEAEIVAEAGGSGAITVATNMAGRGTDIALGPQVEELGGLHVIMSERHDAGRIDRQLAGRAARQGEPGAFFALTSTADQLLTDAALPLTRLIADLSVRLGWPAIARAATRRAQIHAEGQHRRIRRALLLHDEGLNDALAFSGQSE